MKFENPFTMAKKPENVPTKVENKESKFKSALMKAGSTLSFLAAFNMAIGSPTEPEKPNKPDGDIENDLKNKIENASGIINNTLLPKIEKEGQDTQLGNTKAKFIESKNGRIKAVKREGGGLILHRDTEATNPNTGEKEPTGVTTWYDQDSDGSPETVVINHEQNATEADNNILGLQNAQDLSSEFEVVSMLPKNLLVLSFDKNGQAMYLDYKTGEKVNMNKAESTETLNTMVKGYSANLEQATQ